MKYLDALTREDAPVENQPIFDALKSKIGMVPNLYATAANSPVSLNAILNFGETLGSGSFSNREIEAIALAVSEANSCDYCLAAHTALAKMNGFTEAETIDIRTNAVKDSKLIALTTLARSITISRGRPETELVDRFLSAGYTRAALVELIGFVAVNTFNNYLNNIAETTIDFPAAPVVQAV